jgi:hypothetical protein
LLIIHPVWQRQGKRQFFFLAAAGRGAVIGCV